MAVTVKTLTKAAIQLQAGSSYESNAMLALPFKSFNFKPKPGFIKDESINGEGFEGAPQQGVLDIEGSIPIQIDKTCFPAILEAVFGYNTGSNPYSFRFYNPATNRNKKLSLVKADGVYNRQYANVYIKKLSISGKAGGLLEGEIDLIGVTAEAHDTYPSVTNFSQFFAFHECGGANGYVRLGDHVDVLASGDNIEIEEFKFDIVTGHDAEHYNARGILTPEMLGNGAEVTGSITLPRHANDTIIDWRDSATPLQLQMLFYKSATQSMTIQVPNLIVDAELSDDPIAKQNITLHIGRNGLGTSYVNSNMAFTSPISFTVDNA